MPETADGRRADPWELPTYPFTLTAMEMVLLVDRVGNGDLDEGDPERQAVQEPIGRALLEKLGSLYLEMILEDMSAISQSTQTIMVTKREAWLIRNRVSFGDLGFDNKTNIGAGLLRRAFAVILSPDESPSTVDGECDHTITDEQRAALVALNQEASHASTTTD